MSMYYVYDSFEFESLMPKIGIGLGSDFGISKGDLGYAKSRYRTTMWHWYLLVMKGTQ